MMARENMKVGIQKFDDTYFDYWRMQIDDYLYRNRLYLPLLGKKSEIMDDDDWNLLDRQVLEVIRLTLSRSVVHNAIKERTMMNLIAALLGMYEKSSGNNNVHLIKKLFNLKMKMAKGMSVT